MEGVKDWVERMLFVALAVRIDKSNPPVEADVSVPAPIKEVLKRSCYGAIPAKQFDRGITMSHRRRRMVAHDVHQGRGTEIFRYGESTARRSG